MNSCITIINNIIVFIINSCILVPIGMSFNIFYVLDTMYYTFKFNNIQYLYFQSGLMFEKIQRDDHFWKINMVPKSKIFFIEHFKINVIIEELRI